MTQPLSDTDTNALKPCPDDRLEFRPDDKGEFDEIVAKWADGSVHVETLSDQGCYVGFYWDDGRYCQWWIGVKGRSKLTYSHEDGQDAQMAHPTGYATRPKQNTDINAVERAARAIAAERNKTLHGLKGEGHDWQSHIDEAKSAMLASHSTKAPSPVAGDVTQADRDAAAQIVRLGAPGLGNGNKVIADEIKGGLHDNYLVVRTFAQHRLEATPIPQPVDAGELEAALDRMEEAWSDADAHREVRATCRDLLRAALNKGASHEE